MAESDGPNALEGGDLGWRKLGEVPSLFVNQVKKMKTKNISQPIKAPNGFHIIKLAATKHAGSKTLTKNQAQQVFIPKKI